MAASRKTLLHFRHVGHPWPPPKIAPAFSACRPSMAAKKKPPSSGGSEKMRLLASRIFFVKTYFA
jgi:hypothetical protein